jgi:hemolysin III
VDDKGTGQVRRSTQRLRETGSDDAPLARGVVHFVALLVAIPAAFALTWRAGLGGGVWLYATALIGLFAVSATYHRYSWSSAARARWRQVDYAMIYLFIAASMTPYCLLAVPGVLANVVLAIGWLATVVAVTAITFYFHATRSYVSSGYLVLGWLVAVTFPVAFIRLSALQLTCLIATGLLYTLGTVVLATKWPDPRPAVFGYHEVWHTIVVAATACYFLLVWSISTPPG